jgi:hypothetical protein
MAVFWRSCGRERDLAETSGKTDPRIVRLWVFQSDAHGVAGVVLGFGQAAPAQQDQRQFIGGDEIVGI